MINSKASFYGPYKWYYGWNPFWWKVEGYPLLNGINLYRLNDENSAGVAIKLGKLVARIRYSKRTGLWHGGISYNRYKND